MKILTPSVRRPVRVERILLPILIVVAFVFAGLFYAGWNILRDSRLEADRLQRVLLANEDLLSALKDLETGQRGYLLTGQPNYLEPYRKVRQNLQGMIDTLQGSVRNPDQIARARELRTLVEQLVTQVDASIQVRDREGEAAALTLIRLDQGKVLMDQIRRTSDQIRAAGYGLLTANSQQTERRYNETRVGFLAGFGILIAILMLSLSIIQRATDRREQLLEQLDIARQQFQVTLSSIGDGVVTTDAQGKVTFLNPVAAQLTGWRSEDADGHDLEQVFPIFNENTGATVENPARVVLRERRIVGLANHTTLTRRDGSSVPIDDSAAPIYDSENVLQGVVMVFRDVTHRRAAELTLRRWQQVFHNGGFGMAIITPGEEPVFAEVNPAFATMHGYLPQELFRQSYAKVVAPEAWEKKSKLLSGNSEQDHSLTETAHIRKDGSKFPALSDMTFVRDDQGKVLYCVAYCSDISERHRAEEELRRSEERYRVTADSLPQLIWTSRPDGTTEYFNNRWQEETGFTLQQTGDSGWAHFLAEEDRKTCLDKWSHSLQTGETFQVEVRLKTSKDSQYRWYTCRAVPIRDASGKILRWFGSCTDINDQRLAAESLRESKEALQAMNEALRRSNTDLEQFAYAASHDLQEPLRMVAIYSQLLKEECGDKLDGQANSYLDFAIDGALRMEALLKDLLAYSRAPRVDESLKEVVEAQDALAEALANLANLIQENGAEVIHSELPVVGMPKVHLVQVFQNLISNGLKYRKPNEKDQWWEFSVRDNGIGIDPQYRNQIFRIFRRLHGHDVPGTGIGLALCKKLIERNGGAIWVESTLGQGSTFSFTTRANV
jgi:PAS domain S-box-containing protein